MTDKTVAQRVRDYITSKGKDHDFNVRDVRDAISADESEHGAIAGALLKLEEKKVLKRDKKTVPHTFTTLTTEIPVGVRGKSTKATRKAAASKRSPQVKRASRPVAAKGSIFEQLAAIFSRGQELTDAGIQAFLDDISSETLLATLSGRLSGRQARTRR